MNIHDSWYSSDPGNDLPWPTLRVANSKNNHANVLLEANPGQAGMAHSKVGLKVDLQMGQYDWEKIKMWPIRVSIDYSYSIFASWLLYTGSGNAWIYAPDGSVSNRIGYETGEVGAQSDRISYQWDTTLEGLQTGHGGVIICTAVCQAHASEDYATTNYASADVTIESVKIEFLGEPPVASFTYPEKSMVGGNIEFDAEGSYDLDGTIVSYEWDYGDGTPTETVQVPVTSHVFMKAEVYNVKLTVQDDTGFTASFTETLDLSLRIGDIFLCRSDMSYVPSDPWGHAGIYAGKRPDGMDIIIEALNPDGVVASPISRWCWPDMTYVCVVRVNVGDTQAHAAAQFAKSKEKEGDRYNLEKLLMHAFGICDKSLNDDSWYCSELVWAAYMNASGGHCDLDNHSRYKNAIAPDEIASSHLVQLVGEHKEEKPETFVSGFNQRAIGGVAYCPIELLISDPRGRYLDIDRSEIPGGIYKESDLNNDGEMDIFFAIPNPIVGGYTVKVVAKADAQSNEKYSLYGLSATTQIALAEDIAIQDIPEDPYKLNVSGQSDLNNDGRVDFNDFVNLSSEYNRSCSENNNWCRGSDIDTSGYVDIYDLGLLAEYWLSGN